MLQNIRKHAQGWIATIIATILSFAFALWGVEYYLGSNKNKDIVAKVNGEEITAAELNADYQHLNRRMAEQLGSQFLLNSSWREQLKQQALQNLLTRKVLMQAAERAGYHVNPIVVGAVIKQMPEFQRDGKFSLEKFQQIISGLGYNQQQFMAELRQTILLNQVVSGIIGSAFALPNELDNAIILAKQRRDILFSIIPEAKFRREITVTNNELLRYYQQHQSEFKTPAKVKINYVELSLDAIKKKTNVSEQELQEYYNNNTALQKNNVTRAKVKENLVQQKAEQTFSALSDKLADLAFTSPNSLDDIVTTLNLPVKSTEFFSKEEGGSSSMTKNPKIIATGFSNEIVSGNNSSPIELASGHVVVIRVNQYQPEAVAPLQQVKDKIMAKLQNTLASQKVKQLGLSVLSELKQSANINLVAKKHNLAFTVKEQISRSERNLDPKILQAAFKLPQTNVKRAYSFSGVELANGSYAIVALRSIHQFPAAKITEQQRKDMQKILAQSYGKLEYDLLAENQMNKAKIKIIKK
jgi:peptidyl-prolyl cis-trans isomerase D